MTTKPTKDKSKRYREPAPYRMTPAERRDAEEAAQQEADEAGAECDPDWDNGEFITDAMKKD